MVRKARSVSVRMKTHQVLFWLSNVQWRKENSTSGPTNHVLFDKVWVTRPPSNNQPILLTRSTFMKSWGLECIVTSFACKWMAGCVFSKSCANLRIAEWAFRREEEMELLLSVFIRDTGRLVSIYAVVPSSERFARLEDVVGTVWTMTQFNRALARSSRLVPPLHWLQLDYRPRRPDTTNTKFYRSPGVHLAAKTCNLHVMRFFAWTKTG